jgi:hypothetical protein
LRTYGRIAEWHLSAQHDLAPGDLRSTAATMVWVAKERYWKWLYVHYLMIGNIAVLLKKSTIDFWPRAIFLGCRCEVGWFA